MKWDGEWHITYEVFRDLGLAFAAVLILIYVLIGAVGATALTLIAVPLLYFEFFQKKPCPMAEQMEETSKG